MMEVRSKKYEVRSKNIVCILDTVVAPFMVLEIR